MKNARNGRLRVSGMEFAAGGLVWSGRPGRSLLAVIHRQAYGDWTLPKGRRQRGEDLADAALREVQEELSGCVEPKLAGFAGVTWYEKKRRPKVVFYWNMTVAEEPGAFAPNKEVAAVAWLPVRRALTRLDHESERALVAQVVSAGARRPARKARRR